MSRIIHIVYESDARTSSVEFHYCIFVAIEKIRARMSEKTWLRVELSEAVSSAQFTEHDLRNYQAGYFEPPGTIGEIKGEADHELTK